jgi:hypothetical protein
MANLMGSLYDALFFPNNKTLNILKPPRNANLYNKKYSYSNYNYDHGTRGRLLTLQDNVSVVLVPV